MRGAPKKWSDALIMTAQEFLESYFLIKQKHEAEWEDSWQKNLRGYFGEYFLDLRGEADRNWNMLPKVVDAIVEDDDTTSFITKGEGHHTKRYYVKQLNGGFTIERVMIQCEICDGTGRYDEEQCELCDGRGWDDWLD
jgi:hypothetical protein